MRELTREEQVLLHLLQRSNHPDIQPMPEELLRQADWHAVLKESLQQAVLVQAFDAAAAYKKFIPSDIYQDWFRRASQILTSNLRVSGAQKDLVKLMEEHSFPYVILKGEAAAAYYPKPELRHLGDVDFVIPPQRREEIKQILETEGYTNCGHDVGVHVAFEKSGASLEMHYELPGIPYEEPGKRVRAFTENLFRDAALVQLNGHGFHVPDPACHGLILLLHMEKHMLSEGIGLRHLCDWGCYVNRTKGETFWETALLPLLQKIGLLHYAAVMTKLCAIYLGGDCPDWASQAEPRLCADVLEDILDGGNFGRKEIERKNVGMMISYAGKTGTKFGMIHNLWHTLHEVTVYRHPIVRKLPVLHPLFDIYRAVLYLLRVVQGKRPSLTKMAPVAQARRSVYEQLRIFQTD